MRKSLLLFIAISVISSSCTNEKSDKLNGDARKGTDVVDTSILNNNDIVMNVDSMPVKTPSSGDTENVIIPHTNDNMPIVKPDTK
ncbi:MAG TPA: hypothetical protein VF691_21620 [Cytophagaceae bacterium]|jgi:hypothetical protein